MSGVAEVRSSACQLMYSTAPGADTSSDRDRLAVPIKPSSFPGTVSVPPLQVVFTAMSTGSCKLPMASMSSACTRGTFVLSPSFSDRDSIGMLPSKCQCPERDGLPARRSDARKVDGHVGGILRPTADRGDRGPASRCHQRGQVASTCLVRELRQHQVRCVVSRLKRPRPQGDDGQAEVPLSRSWPGHQTESCGS